MRPFRTGQRSHDYVTHRWIDVYSSTLRGDAGDADIVHAAPAPAESKTVNPSDLLVLLASFSPYVLFLHALGHFREDGSCTYTAPCMEARAKA